MFCILRGRLSHVSETRRKFVPKDLGIILLRHLEVEVAMFADSGAAIVFPGYSYC